jgi:large subunit ribosomal protein L15
MSVKLPKIVKKSKKRVGRGYGSGKGGHTAGRGMKGQKSRYKRHILFEGLKMKKSFIKRLPLKRGKGKFKPKPKPIIVKLEYLNLLRANTRVDLEVLIKEGIVDEKNAKEYGVKILGGGKLSKKLTIDLPISGSAAKQVEKVGGKVISQIKNKKIKKVDGKKSKKKSGSKNKDKK